MIDTATPSFHFNLFDEALISAPYPTYHRLRSDDPVHWNPTMRCWVITRMRDVAAILHDSNFASGSPAQRLGELGSRANRNYDPLIRLLDASLLLQEGPRHRRNRQTIAKIMNRVPVRKLRPAVEAIASSLCAKIQDRKAYDAVVALAAPFPQYVMAYLLGLPAADVPVLDDLLDSLGLIFDLATLEVYDKVNTKLAVALELFRSRISEAIEARHDSGLALLYGGARGSHEQKLAEAAAVAVFLYRAGVDPITGLVGMLFRLMIERPSLLERIRIQPELLSATVSEVIRLESNIQRTIRVCREACVIGGKVIRAGERVMLLLGAANRDPAACAEPDELDPQRSRIADVAFGAGRHSCLGVNLAQLEGCVALERMLHLPPIELAGQEEWYLSRSVRRLTRLPVRVKDSARLKA